MAKTCAACGEPGSGKFCAQCGASLEGPGKCADCANPLPARARYCNMCGTPVASSAAKQVLGGPSAASSRSSSQLPRIVAGAAVLIAAAVLILPRFSPSDPAPLAAPPPPIAGAPVGDPSSIDLTSISPRDAADRLFNRVMTSASAGDTAAAQSFAPMAVAAYELAEPLDLDGRYHVATLYLVSGDYEAAAAEAAAILEQDSTHLFGLFSAAEAAEMSGDSGAARSFFQRFLDSYDGEIATGKIEYSVHDAILPEMRRQAVAAVGN